MNSPPSRKIYARQSIPAGDSSVYLCERRTGRRSLSGKLTTRPAKARLRAGGEAKTEDHIFMQIKHLPLILGGMLTLGLAGAALAQDSPPPQDQTQRGRGMGRMDPDAQLQRLTQQLDLTTDQQSQIKPVLVERQ